MKRNIVFLLGGKLKKNSIQHLEKMSKKFNLKFKKFKIFNFSLCIVCEEEPIISISKSEASFNIGRLSHSLAENSDRFVDIKITDNKIILDSDYVGSIPVYYSCNQKNFTFSNIEPCVVLNSEPKDLKISPQQIFELTKFTHPLWDKTIFQNIKFTKPDSKFIYNYKTNSIEEKNKRTVFSSNKRINYSDKEVANDLYKLNKKLVTQSLSGYEEIILPLSSGYDSRMILAVITENEELKAKTKCFTYGGYTNIEAQAAKRMCQKHNIFWKHIDLNCEFLKAKYLHPILEIFGSTLQVHGMYQLEFLEQIKPYFATDKPILTSGFMTGVPAGQHISLIFPKYKLGLVEAMNQFPQSNGWNSDEFKINKKDFLVNSENEFKKAASYFKGKLIHQSVVFDIWTRQRNFISYYPKTLEWILPIISPHLSTEYANFFFSLNDKHLTDRKAVELMFQYHYPKLASVVSNSNKIKSITKKRLSKQLFKLANSLKKRGLGFLLSDYYKNTDFKEFDNIAITKSGARGLYPLNQIEIRKEIFSYFHHNSNLFEEALLGGGGLILKLQFCNL